MSDSPKPETDQLPPRIPVVHNAAVAGAILAPLAMMLPPRKVDIRFFVLVGAFSLSTNQLAYEYTGQSIYSRFGSRVSGVFGDGLPEGAKRTQQLLKEQRERDSAGKKTNEKDSNIVKDIWMGGEGEDWREKRAAEHQQAFDEGKGLSDLIFEQVAEVWRGTGSSSKKSDDNSTESKKD